jgi:acyl carrier protein
MKDLYETLTPLFRDVFDLDDLVVTPQLTPTNLPEWDSLANVRLMVAIERTFDIRFDFSEVTLLPSAAALVDIIDSHLQRHAR